MIQLEVLTPRTQPVLDNSTLSTHQRCPRKALYQYVLHRAPASTNYPIGFGVAYHRFREVIEKLYITGKFDLDVEAEKEILFATGWGEAVSGWEDPPPEHNKSWMTKARLRETCVQSFERWLREKRQGRFEVIETERAFDLPLPSGRRYGGRFDQIVVWNNRLWVRDFKTTSRMGRNYALQFDPDNQMTGYVWGAQQLSGRKVEGVIIEVVYNTKTKGPEFHQFLSTRTAFHIDQWIKTVEDEYDDWAKHLEKGFWPMRTTACNDYGGCYFRDACGQNGWPNIERWLLAETIESTWDFTNPDEEEGVVD